MILRSYQFYKIHQNHQLKENQVINQKYDNLQCFFRNTILDVGCPAYVEQKLPSAENMIDFIRQTGAVSILAHPCLIKLNEKDLYNEIARLKKVGLQGMEVQHSDMSIGDMKKYQSWADDLGLLKSGGSDFHGKNAHYGIELGIERGQLNIPHEYIEKIIAASGK